MRTVLHVTFLLLLFHSAYKGQSQITTPVVRANFGVDGDLRSNFINNAAQAGQDDWFVYPSTTGAGQFVIDTTGAAAIVSGYSTNTASRKLSFMKSMSVPVFSVINNQLLMDAAYVRDYHGDDSTVFASGSNKNGDSPGLWTCPVSQGIPDKNDILDMMVHVRRAGPNSTDSLWMFGAVSLDNITGNRYFDFEMYQTNLTWTKATGKFSGYGPDAGHTSWEFDANGNIIKAGDIIFSAEYQSSSLTAIEARIWINRSALSVVPQAFDWSGKFDGASSGATYGYASIKPKSDGTYFTGLQSSTATWGGPFAIVLQNDNVVTDYTAKQFVEFSVNLTKLGLDPVTSLTGSSCTMPYKSLLVKTRSSASFTAELKDFIMPVSVTLPQKALTRTATPFMCEKLNVAEIYINGPVSTSTYNWSTQNGSIISSTSGTSIFVDKPGTYVVQQYLQQGCLAYATDTITISPFPFCGVLAANRIYDFTASSPDQGIQLNWKVQDNQQVAFFEIQNSADETNFKTVATVAKNAASLQNSYSYKSAKNADREFRPYYRIVLTNVDGAKIFSQVLHLKTDKSGSAVKIYPNPVKDKLFVQFMAPATTEMKIELYNAAGNPVFSASGSARQGLNEFNFAVPPGVQSGFCFVLVRCGNQVFRQKVLVIR